MKSLAQRVPVTGDLALLIARVALGVVFIAHGWQKLHDWTISGTTDGFRSMDVPMPALSAQFATWVELVGGAMLVLGVLMPLAGGLLFLDMVGALIFVHIDSGLFVDNGGWEMVAVYGATSLVLAVLGSGRFGFDALLGRQKSAVEHKTPEPVSS